VAPPAPGALPRRGRFPAPVTLAAAVEAIGAALDMQGRLRVCGAAERVIQTVAVCGGSGGEYIDAGLVAAGVDLYVTGDVSHHEAQAAKELGLCLIDGGHFATESHFVRVMAGRLREAFPGALTIYEYTASQDPWG